MLAAFLVAVCSAASAQATTGSGWQDWSGTPANVGGAGIVAVSDTDVWTGTDQGGVQHWNGASWDAPKPLPGTSPLLTELAAVSSTDIWGAGVQILGDDNPGTGSPLLAHWNGTSWTQPAGLINPNNDSSLVDVDASTAGNVWAVGTYYDNAANGGAGGQRALAVRWSGTSFTSYTPATTTQYNGFHGVSASGSADVWAAGADENGMLVEHWNGSSWSISLSGVAGHLYDIYEASPTNVWAVGSDGAFEHAVVEHWNGTSWTQVAIPDVTDAPGGSGLFAIAGTSASNMWAVGQRAGPNTRLTLAIHNDGTGWKVADTPNRTGMTDPGNFRQLSVPTAGLAYATGGDSNGSYLARYGPGDFTSQITNLGADNAPVVIGQAASFHGRLDYSDHASPWGATVDISRTNPDQSVTPLADATANDDGSFAFTDMPPTRGSYAYTASYAGSASRTGSNAELAVDVQGQPTTLTLKADAATIRYQGTVHLTVQVGSHLPGASVRILKTSSATGKTTTLAEGLVGADGIFTAAATLTKNATFQAKFDGDLNYNPKSSKPVPVGVHVKITGVEKGWYAKSGRYKLYHFTTGCSTRLRACPAYTVAVKPNKAGRRVHLVLQNHTARGWRTIGDAWAKLNTKSMTTIRVRYANDRRIIGHQFRQHATYRADTQNAGTIGAWAYFKITS